MAKYNILVVTSPFKSGVEYHRQLVPHAYLRSNTDFEIATINEIESESFTYNGETILMDDFLKSFQLVQFSRTVSTGWNMEKVIAKLNRLGIVSFLDIDDYWHYGRTHVLYDQHLKDEVPAKTLRSIKLVDHITTTTEYFADTIKHYSKNVTVLENAINPNEPQFEINNKPSDRVRFGWLGSQCHILDMGLLSKPLYDLNKLNLDYKMVYGGYMPNEVGKFFEVVLTSNGTLHDDKYMKSEWKDCFNYATVYNDFDVILAPLTDNKFNHCKSEIKLIEAGFMKKGAIVSKIMPYTIIGKHKSNCLMVKPNKHQDWLTAFKYYIQNPNAVTDMAEQLYEDVKERYHIKTVNEKRVDLYTRLIEAKNK